MALIIWESQLLIKILTSYHPNDKYPVPLIAANHADYNAPPTKQTCKWEKRRTLFKIHITNSRDISQKKLIVPSVCQPAKISHNNWAHMVRETWHFKDYCIMKMNRQFILNYFPKISSFCMSAFGWTSDFLKTGIHILWIFRPSKEFNQYSGETI